MKAVFTGNPYKFWNRDCNCELHLFDDDELAAQYATSLFRNLLRNEAPCICKTPNETGWAGESWAKLVCDYASCQGFDKIVLHPDDNGFSNDFIEWTIVTALPYDTCINWTWPYETPWHINKLYADIRLNTDENEGGLQSYWLHGSHKERCENLCDLLHDLFDVKPFEIYDFYDGDTCFGDIMSYEEVIG